MCVHFSGACTNTVISHRTVSRGVLQFVFNYVFERRRPFSGGKHVLDVNCVSQMIGVYGIADPICRFSRLPEAH